MIEEIRTLYSSGGIITPSIWEIVSKMNEIIRQVNTLTADVQMLLQEKEENNIGWDAFRAKAAKDFMAAVITREAPQYNFACRNVADRTTEAIMWADELIKQLKERE